MKRVFLVAASMSLTLMVGLIPAGWVNAATNKVLTITDTTGATCSFQLDQDGLLSIKGEDGSVDVTALPFEDCRPGGGAAIALAAGPSTVGSGGAVTLLWAETGAENCVRVADPAVADWSGPLPSGNQATVNPTAPVGEDRTYEFSIECDNSISSEVVSVVVQGSEPEPPPPLQISNFRFNNTTASNRTLNAGDSLAVTWQTSEPATCQALGNFPGWVPQSSAPISSPRTLSNLNAGGSSQISGTVRVRCETSDGRIAQTSQFTVTVRAVEQQGCENARPADWSRKQNCLWNSQGGTDCASFTGMFGSPFPGTTSAKQFHLREDQYVALELPSDLSQISDSLRVQISANEGQFGVPQRGPKVWTISRCPGDFNRSRIEGEMGAGCFRAAEFPLTGFVFGGTASNAACKLDFQDTELPQLYLNIVYATPTQSQLDDPTSWDWACGNVTTDLCGEHLSASSSGQ